MIANEAAARLLSPTRDALGQEFAMPFFKTPATIVGIVEDVRRRGLDQPSRAELLVPYPQMPWPFLTLAVRSTQRPGELSAAVRAQLQALDPEQPLFDVQTMDERLAGSIAPRRFALLLLGVFALLALLLASVGTYGVIAYLVQQRTHEVGIRRALGARASHVRRLFLGQGLALGLVGIALGMLGALALGETIASLLFGVASTDAATFLSVALLMTLIVLAACWLPSRRALGVDPLVALRHE
jgi:putative ABC transport system permease protein